MADVPDGKYSSTTTIGGIDYRFVPIDNMTCDDCDLYRHNCHFECSGIFVLKRTDKGPQKLCLPLKPNASLKEIHGYLCERYRDKFMEMYFTDGKGGYQADNFWIGEDDDFGDMLDVAGEYTFNFATIRYAVDHNVHPDRLFEWWDYCRTVSDFDIKAPTLRAFCNGAPLVSDKQLEKLVKLKQELEDEVAKYRDKWEKGGF